MINYQKARIYKITSEQAGDKSYVTGSTKPPYTVIAYFRHLYKNTNRQGAWSQLMNYDDAKIETIEVYPCENKKQLNERIKHHCLNTPNCINKPLELELAQAV